MSCKHANKVCKNLKWAKSKHRIETNKGRYIESGNADVELWYCNDCKNWLHYNSYTNKCKVMITKEDLASV